MQIHELNNFTGTLGSGAYLAVDDGNDTGKLSTQQLLAATEARIDNIIAGPAPSAEEIVDARYGADGVTYPSLGDAIRDQVTDLKSDIDRLEYPILEVSGETMVSNYSAGGDGWTGNYNDYLLYGVPLLGGLKHLKVKAKFEYDVIELRLAKKVGNQYIVTDLYRENSVNNGYVEFNDIQFEGARYAIISGASIVRTDITPTKGYMGKLNEISGDVLGTLTENTTYGYVLDLVSMLPSYSGVDPDWFFGTDTEKLQQALDFCSDKGGQIIIRRKYVTASTITIRHIYENNDRIIVQGMSKDAEIVCNTSYGFQGVDGHTGGVLFRDLKISGGASSFSIFYGGEQFGDKNLINVFLENCYLSNFPILFYANNYVQSFWLVNCIIRSFSSSLINTSGYQWYNVNILQCVIESADGNGIGRICYAEAVNIKNNVIEGNTSAKAMIVEGAYALNIEGNYFEGNGYDILMDGLATDARNVRIVGNFFTESNSCITLPNSANATYKGTISIINNSIVGNGYLITGRSDQIYNEVFCAFNMGNVTDLPSTSLKVRTPADF